MGVHAACTECVKSLHTCTIAGHSLFSLTSFQNFSATFPHLTTWSPSTLFFRSFSICFSLFCDSLHTQIAHVSLEKPEYKFISLPWKLNQMDTKCFASSHVGKTCSETKSRRKSKSLQ